VTDLTFVQFYVGQITGKPRDSFPLPWMAAKDVIPSHEGDDVIEVDQAGAAVGSQDLDYDFRCYFLYTKRTDLYRRLDLRCEQMLKGNPRRAVKLGSLACRRDASNCLQRRECLMYSDFIFWGTVCRQF
jgi:tRNA A37 N6-isopentenylltransferase MiaA